MAVNRREFLAMSAAAGAAVVFPPLATAAQPAPRRKHLGPAETVRLGVMGVRGRGAGLASSFAGLDGAEVAVVCDVDERVLPPVASAVEGRQRRAPRTERDFRAILDDYGIHLLDVARWMLGVEWPLRASSGGGKLHYDDDRETPDHQIATFEYVDCSIVWEHVQWSHSGPEGPSWGLALYGADGTLVVDEDGWRVLNSQGQADPGLPQAPGAEIENPHLRNFLDCVRSRQRPNADIEIGHVSTGLCHLGNIAQRTTRKLAFNAETETFPGDDAANALLGRQYREPWTLPDVE